MHDGPGMWKPTGTGLLILAALASCKQEAPAPAATLAADEAALARAEGAAKGFGKTLKQRLMAAIGEGGAPRALAVCSEEAKTIRETVARQQDASVGRASLKLRSKANTAPPWVAAWLDAQKEGPAAGAAGIRQVVETPNGKVARFLAPIEVEAVCLQCHGPSEAIAPEVKSALAARYPEDAATGYALGDLRGALWAEVPAR